jgi:hypothetical protein
MSKNNEKISRIFVSLEVFFMIIYALATVCGLLAYMFNIENLLSYANLKIVLVTLVLVVMTVAIMFVVEKKK